MPSLTLLSKAIRTITSSELGFSTSAIFTVGTLIGSGAGVFVTAGPGPTFTFSSLDIAADGTLYAADDSSHVVLSISAALQHDAACPRGFYCSSGTLMGSSSPSFPSRWTCPAAHYCPQGSSAPTPCPVGTNSSLVGQWDVLACQACPAGSISNANTVCTVCASGKYARADQGACLSCSPGTFSLTRGASSISTCINCMAGYSNANTPDKNCTPCDIGEYSDAGQKACSPCPAGTFSSAPASAGCTACPAGEVSSAGQSECSSRGCGAGFFSTGTSVCGICQPGYFCPNGYNATPCAVNTFNANLSASKIGDCLPCLSGSISPLASSSKSNCTACLPGTYAASGTNQCLTCPPGKTSGASAVCTNCTAGRATEGSTVLCSICPSGFYAYLGAASCSPCPANTSSRAREAKTNVCLACTGVLQSLPGATTCSATPSSAQCANGTFFTGDACAACPPGSACVAGSATLCKPGSFQSNPLSSNCTLCPSNTFNNATGSTSREECTACGANLVAAPGSSSCDSTCSPGTYFAAGSCKNCDAGKYAPLYNSSSCSCVTTARPFSRALLLSTHPYSHTSTHTHSPRTHLLQQLCCWFI